MRRTGDKGFAWVPVLIVVGGIALIYLGLMYLWGRPAEQVPVPEDVCQCKDLYEMESRVAQATAAINHINGMAQTQMQQPNGSSTMYTPAQYDQGVPDTDAAMSGARRPGARVGSGKTDANCKSEVTSYSACLRAGLQKHENVHIAACRAYTDSPQAKSGPADWKEAKTMINYWIEDMAAYQAEIDYFNRQIQRVKNDPACKPKVATYQGRESKENQQERQAAAKRRVADYAKIIG